MTTRICDNCPFLKACPRTTGCPNRGGDYGPSDERPIPKPRRNRTKYSRVTEGNTDE